MTEAIDVSLVRFAAVFIPELRPLIPDVVAAIDIFERAEAIAQPYLGQPGAGVRQILPALFKLQPMMGEIVKASVTAEKVQAILQSYKAKIDAAELGK